MKNHKNLLLVTLLLVLLSGGAIAQNPFIMDQFTADPTARVFNGRVYVYPSHDIPVPASTDLRKDWFCMEDYHVFSSANLVDWVDHGMIVSQTQVPWVDAKTYSMWAPDCVTKNGKYYFYFPANKAKVGNARGGFGVGVGIADKPEGPFVFQSEPIVGISGIDPCVLNDTDGQSYIYWPSGGIRVSKLKPNMIELEGESKSLEIKDLPSGFKEGPFVFERAGFYYLTFPLVRNKTEELAYCMGTSPEGPFTYKGTIMDESPTGCWTNHHSIVEFKNQWYLFYHHNDLSPNFDKNRSIRVDSLNFNADGTIQKVIPTFRGVGVTNATSLIQLDRYTQLSTSGASIDFLDSTKTFDGWKINLDKPNAWVRYNAVQFNSPKTLEVRVLASTSGELQLCLDNENGPVVATINVAKKDSWQLVSTKVQGLKNSKHDLVLKLKSNASLSVDWVRFK